MAGGQGERISRVRRRSKLLMVQVPIGGMVLTMLSLGVGGFWGLLPLLLVLVSLVGGFIYAFHAMLTLRCRSCGMRPLSFNFPFWPFEPPRCARCGIADVEGGSS